MCKLLSQVWRKPSRPGTKSGPKIPSLELDLKDDFGPAIQRLNQDFFGHHEQERAQQLLRFLIRVGQVKRVGAWQERDWSQLQGQRPNIFLRELVNSWFGLLCKPRILVMNAPCCRSLRRRKELGCFGISRSNVRLAKGILWAFLELEKEESVPAVLDFAASCNEKLAPLGRAAPNLARYTLNMVLQKEYWPLILMSIEQYPALHEGPAGHIVQRLLERTAFRA